MIVDCVFSQLVLCPEYCGLALIIVRRSDHGDHSDV